ncbi:MAG: TlpA family protein disulfide reductase, partial [Butyricimonas faecihominis]
PCRAMMQQLKELYKTYAGQSVDFISISLDYTEKAWLPAHEEEQIPWGSYWLKENFKSTIAERLGIEAIPFIVVVDQKGRIAGKNLRDQKLIDKVSELLK